MSTTGLQEKTQTTAQHPAMEAQLDEPEELERDVDDEPTMVAPVVIPPVRRPVEQEDEPVSPQRRHVLEHLIHMADMYARNGSLRQAIELYFTLVFEHDGTEQAIQAGDRLMAIAQEYENHGELRLARGVYERLLKAS